MVRSLKINLLQTEVCQKSDIWLADFNLKSTNEWSVYMLRLDFDFVTLNLIRWDHISLFVIFIVYMYN
jgi:hypothetical protein